jgi:translation elongation factor EF-Tu-like GTPase
MHPEVTHYAAGMPTTFNAELRLLTAPEGGREAPLRSGYRSVARLGDDEELWGVEITFDVPAMLAPGESAVVSLMAWADPQTPSAGTTIKVYEGARLVGTGTVRE